MRGTIIKGGATALLMTLITVNQALADSPFCNWTAAGCGGDAAAVPEFNGPGAIAAIALLVSIGAVFYNKVRK
jgi:hypothetical protein